MPFEAGAVKIKKKAGSGGEYCSAIGVGFRREGNEE